MRIVFLAAWLLVLFSGYVKAEPRLYLEIVVQACKPAETALEPTNQGHSYDEDPEYTSATHDALMKKMECREVPIPPTFITSPISISACRGKLGYLAALQFIEQRQDLAAFPAVGGWHCIVSPYPVIDPVDQ